MLRDKIFFKILWRLINFCGLQPHKLERMEKIRVILFFVFLIGANTILLIVELVLNDDIEARLNALQIFPSFIQVVWESLNFAIKSKAIEKMFNKLDDLFIKIEGEDILNRGFYKYKFYFVINGIMSVVASFGGIFLFGITGKTPVLIYTPYPNGLGFFLIWLLQSTFLIYTTLLLYLADEILISLLVFLSFYLKALRRKIQRKKISELSDIIQLNLELRR